MPGQAAQVSPPSPPLPALLRGGTGENPCLKKTLPTAEGINCHDGGCLWPCVAPRQRQTLTPASAHLHLDLHGGGGIMLVSILYVFRVLSVKIQINQ